MNLGPHAAFIWASYAVTAVALAGLVMWIVSDGRRQRRLLDELEAQGVRRRSAPAPSSDPAQRPQ